MGGRPARSGAAYPRVKRPSQHQLTGQAATIVVGAEFTTIFTLSCLEFLFSIFFAIVFSSLKTVQKINIISPAEADFLREIGHTFQQLLSCVSADSNKLLKIESAPRNEPDAGEWRGEI